MSREVPGSAVPDRIYLILSSALLVVYRQFLLSFSYFGDRQSWVSTCLQPKVPVFQGHAGQSRIMNEVPASEV